MPKLLSLNRNMVRDGLGSFTLEDTIPAKVDEFATCSTEPRVKIKQARRSIEIDQDVVDSLRAKFGSMPLGRAIRIILGLKPKIAQNAWQEEEDYLIREYYPLNGGPPLAEVLGRSVDCIRDRASDLGVQRKWVYGRVTQKQVNRYVKHYPSSSTNQLVTMVASHFGMSIEKADIMVNKRDRRE